MSRVCSSWSSRGSGGSLVRLVLRPTRDCGGKKVGTLFPRGLLDFHGQYQDYRDVNGRKGSFRYYVSVQALFIFI